MTPSTLLRQARKTAGLSQAELAARLGVSQPVVARLESRRSNPTWDTVVRALDATGHEIELKRRAPAAAGLDLGQLRERIVLTPAERLRLFQGSQRRLRGLTASARRRSRG